MAKVKCAVCANEKSGLCTIKKIGVKVNKSRKCEAYVYDYNKVKSKTEVPTVKIGYAQMEENRRRMKEQLKEIKRLMKEKPADKTAENLGLIEPVENKIITPGDPNFSMPIKDTKHPLTGDLSRFTTTSTRSENDYKNKV